MWGLAVNMLSKQSQITDKRWYAILQLGEEILLPKVENQRAKKFVSVFELSDLLQL